MCTLLSAVKCEYCILYPPTHRPFKLTIINHLLCVRPSGSKLNAHQLCGVFLCGRGSWMEWLQLGTSQGATIMCGGFYL